MKGLERVEFALPSTRSDMGRRDVCLDVFPDRAPRQPFVSSYMACRHALPVSVSHL